MDLLKLCQVIMESEEDFCDKYFALHDYMKQQGYLKIYKIICLVSKTKNFVHSLDINIIW